MEERHEEVEQIGHLTPLICARFLGYMVIEAPSVEGRLEISTEIIRCTEDHKFQQLANLYKDHFVRCFKAAKGRTPTPSRHPSAPSFNAQKDRFREKLVETPSNYVDAKKLALRRDNFRCMLTGKLDAASILRNDVKYTDDLEGAPTNPAHIFDQSTNQNLANVLAIQREYAASAHAVLDRFGQINSIEELNGPAVHRLQNILTLEIGKHMYFDQLNIWLERKPDVMVEFTSSDPELALPDPRYLALHAACARVAHLSGAAEYLSEIFDDLEQLKVLVKDGSSTEALYHALICNGRRLSSKH
ncbi:hypothetical protein M422DRAFT_153287 [Sphaerobolus stellatus SS14]|nr:hypothetical protein M422DRAFT_153287 [Sphaerobolus stellatus SS14]